MAQDEPRRPLTPAQGRTTAALPWYRAWLLSTGRTEAELDPTPPKWTFRNHARVLGP